MKNTKKKTLFADEIKKKKRKCCSMKINPQPSQFSMHFFSAPSSSMQDATTTTTKIKVRWQKYIYICILCTKLKVCAFSLHNLSYFRELHSLK